MQRRAGMVSQRGPLRPSTTMTITTRALVAAAIAARARRRGGGGVGARCGTVRTRVTTEGPAMHGTTRMIRGMRVTSSHQVIGTMTVTVLGAGIGTVTATTGATHAATQTPPSTLGTATPRSTARARRAPRRPTGTAAGGAVTRMGIGGTRVAPRATKRAALRRRHRRRPLRPVAAIAARHAFRATTARAAVGGISLPQVPLRSLLAPTKRLHRRPAQGKPTDRPLNRRRRRGSGADQEQNGNGTLCSVRRPPPGGVGLRAAEPLARRGTVAPRGSRDGIDGATHRRLRRRMRRPPRIPSLKCRHTARRTHP